jgi:type II secretory pathway pseudopilin PulG
MPFSQTLWHKVCEKSAFTLIELLVYIAIMGFIIVVAGRAFSDSTEMRVRSQNMLTNSEEAGRVTAILKEDISQLGVKSWGRSSASAYVFDTVAGVNINYTGNSNTEDLSSYELTKNNPSDNFDRLKFRKAYFDKDGNCKAIAEIEWYVESNGKLFRKCNVSTLTSAKCSGGDENEVCPGGDSVEMAKNVSEFKFLPSKPGSGNSSASGTTGLPYPAPSTNAFNVISTNATYKGEVSGNGNSFILKEFKKNTATGNNNYSLYCIADVGNSACKSFTFNAGEEYVISFELPYEAQEEFAKMSMFQVGRDHLSIGIRSSTTSGSNPYGNPISGVSDFLFYPPQGEVGGNNMNKKRHFEFSVPATQANARIAITAAFNMHSPAADGHLKMDNFKVYAKTDNVYHFDHRSSESNYNPSANSSPTTANRASVKAFELTLGIKSKNNKEFANVITVIPIPNNGVAGGP